MIIIYFKGGYTAAVPGATQIARAPGAAGAGPFNVRCTDAAGHELGRFTEHEMLGYVIVPDARKAARRGRGRRRWSRPGGHERAQQEGDIGE